MALDKKNLEALAKARGLNPADYDDVSLFRDMTGFTQADEKFINTEKNIDWYVPGGAVLASSDAPTAAPTDEPTDTPTDTTTEAPTDAPTDEPTDEPTDDPTDGPGPNDVVDHIGEDVTDENRQFDIDNDGDIDEDDVAKSTLDIITENTVIANTPEVLANITTPDTADVVIANAEVMNSLTGNTYYNSITLAGNTIDSTINLKAHESIALKDIVVSGPKGSSNGKILFTAKDLELNNVSLDENSTVYNAFEGSQAINDPNYTGLETLTANNVNFEDPSLTHNVINVYTPADNAVITIKNSKFDLNVNTSNVLRLSNYLNSENVTVNFENVEWTYESAVSSSSDWTWAGLVIYQPASADAALTGDTSKVATWKFNFKDCKYNGTKVTGNNFGEHNQVAYAYNINKTGKCTDLSEIATITFA